MPEPLRQDLCALGARFLVSHSHGAGADPVARFHLDNGARLERVNFAADLSRKGLKQSLGLMVNYLYDLSSLEKRHQQFVDGEVSHAGEVRRLLRPRA
jgi:malonyl-CoA decarboxylase